MENKLQIKLSVSLLVMRIGIFIVFLFWGLDKVIVPEHASRVISGFYGMNIPISAIIILGVAQLIFLSAFLVGMWKKYTYGAILVLHASSTLASFGKYSDPFNNLLFFAAWPMLGACFALFILRDYDTFTITK